jgi:hypothetical protein
MQYLKKIDINKVVIFSKFKVSIYASLISINSDCYLFVNLLIMQRVINKNQNQRAKLQGIFKLFDMLTSV